MLELEGADAEPAVTVTVSVMVTYETVTEDAIIETVTEVAAEEVLVGSAAVVEVDDAAADVEVAGADMAAGAVLFAALPLTDPPSDVAAGVGSARILTPAAAKAEARMEDR